MSENPTLFLCPQTVSLLIEKSVNDNDCYPVDLLLHFQVEWAHDCYTGWTVSPSIRQVFSVACTCLCRTWSCCSLTVCVFAAKCLGLDKRLIWDNRCLSGLVYNGGERVWELATNRNQIAKREDNVCSQLCPCLQRSCTEGSRVRGAVDIWTTPQLQLKVT